MNSNLQITHQQVFFANGAKGYKFYQVVIVEDAGHGVYWTLFNWGTGRGYDDLSSGQVQIEGPYGTPSAALAIANSKAGAKTGKGYWLDRTIVVTGYSPLPVPLYMASLLQADSRYKTQGVNQNGVPTVGLRKNPLAAGTAAQRQAEAQAKLDAKLQSTFLVETTTTAVLMSRELDGELASLIVAERERLTTRRRELHDELDRIDVQIDALNAKLTS